GILDDLLRLPVAQVDDGHAGVRLVGDEEPLPVVLTVGAAETWVMRIAPLHRLPVDGARAHDLVAHAEAPSLPRLGRVDADGAQDAHGGNADGEDLPGVPGG